jgi:hypothetical protein
VLGVVVLAGERLLLNADPARPGPVKPFMAAYPAPSLGPVFLAIRYGEKAKLAASSRRP